MELCSDNLKNIIEQKFKCFERQSSETMDLIEFFISCQLFKEILESVEYLHESNPPIIHRDLKPHNILINEKPKNDRFLKICDFGLAKEHEYNSMSHTEGVGTRRYCAPEVLIGFNGNYKSDIYSLGKMTEVLFDFNIDSESPEKIFTKHKLLEKKWNLLEEIVSKMTKTIYADRPTCAELLSQFNSWDITANELKSDENHRKNVKKLKQFSNKFFYNFFKEKFLY